MRGLAAGLLLLPLAAFAADPRPHPWDLRLEGARDNLDEGYEDWREFFAQLSWRPDTRTALFGNYREAERFSKRDREGGAGLYYPLGNGGTVLHAEGTWSSTRHVLPAKSIR